jgi:Zn-dependent protease with chaperone function
MAHELGHFSQRGSTWLERLVRRVNMWMNLAITRRDRIDDLIDYLAEFRIGLIALLSFVLWIFIWMGRGILWLIMQLGLLVSASLMRRTVFDADRYSLGLAGSDVFQQTLERMVLINEAHAVASQHFFKGKRQGDHLPRDFPAFVVGLAEQSSRAKKKAARRLKNEKLRWLSPQPTTRSRIRAAQRLDRPGTLRSDLPGGAMFRDFASTCRRLSHAEYEARFASAYYPATNRATKEAVRQYLETMERG